MNKKFKIYVKCVGLVFCLSASVLNAQILKDTLSRMSDANGDKRGKKIYRKEAIELADFKKIDFDD